MKKIYTPLRVVFYLLLLAFSPAVYNKVYADVTITTVATPATGIYLHLY